MDTWDVDPDTTCLTWLADPEPPDELLPDDGQPIGLPVSWLLDMLCTSVAPLPDWAATELGYQQPRYIGDAAIDLLLAVSDPHGPRCPSFGTATTYLRELDPRNHRFDPA